MASMQPVTSAGARRPDAPAPIVNPDRTVFIDHQRRSVRIGNRKPLEEVSWWDRLKRRPGHSVSVCFSLLSLLFLLAGMGLPWFTAELDGDPEFEVAYDIRGVQVCDGDSCERVSYGESVGELETDSAESAAVVATILLCLAAVNSTAAAVMTVLRQVENDILGSFIECCATHSRRIIPAVHLCASICGIAVLPVYRSGMRDEPGRETSERGMGTGMVLALAGGITSLLAGMMMLCFANEILRADASWRRDSFNFGSPRSSRRRQHDVELGSSPSPTNGGDSSVATNPAAGRSGSLGRSQSQSRTREGRSMASFNPMLHGRSSSVSSQSALQPHPPRRSRGGLAEWGNDKRPKR